MSFVEDRVKREKEIFEAVANNDAVALKNALTHMKIEADLVDENGMTPLQHACYKGNKEIAQMLIDQGADVNVSKHKHNYSALHFAALSGNAELCQLLLSEGARTHSTNSVNRTASQMASFVGNHSCVAVINNFLPRSEVDYFTVPRGLEKEPRLAPHLAAPLHKFILQINLNPARIAMNLHGVLLDNLDQIATALELMRDKEAKRGVDTCEVAAFKFHYLESVVREVRRLQKIQQEQLKRLHEEAKSRGEESSKDAEKDKEDRKWDPIETFVKAMLKRSPSNTMDNQERFLRDIIREFPYRESILFRQMVSSLVPAESSSALAVITSAVNGTRAFSDNVSTACATCGDERASRRCSKCRQVQYCDRECQRLHWPIHRKECARIGTVQNQESATQDVSNQMSELKRRMFPSISSNDSSFLLFSNRAGDARLSRTAMRNSSLMLSVPRGGPSISVSNRTAVLKPSRKLTLSELREPSSVFYSRTPDMSDFRVPLLQLDLVSRSTSIVQAPPHEYPSFEIDQATAKKARLSFRYPLLPALGQPGSFTSKRYLGDIPFPPQRRAGKRNFLNLYGVVYME